MGEKIGFLAGALVPNTRIVLIAIVLIATPAGIVLPATIRVPSNEPTIQAGIDKAVHGDTVLVADGVYRGDGNRNLDFGGKSIVLRSENGPEATTISCFWHTNPDPNRGFYFHSGESPEAIIEGFTIRYGEAKFGGGVYCEYSSSPTIRNCKFLSNRAEYGAAVFCVSASPIIDDCYFYMNSAPNGGVFTCALRCSPVISNCVFDRNICIWQGCFVCQALAEPLLINCTFYANRPAALYCDNASPTLSNCIIAMGRKEAVSVQGSSANPIFQCCNIYGNIEGDWIGGIADQLGINGNISAHPLFCDAGYSNFQISNLSPCHPDSSPCGLIGARDVGCSSTFRRWVVNVDGSGDAPTIQAAIDSSTHGDTIIVNEGTYTGKGNYDMDFNGKLIVLWAPDGPENTIIDRAPHTSEYDALGIQNGETEAAVVKGFTFANGKRGINCTLGSKPRIVNCIFRENGRLDGGHAFIVSGRSKPQIHDCLFADNTSEHGASFLCVESSPQLARCIFQGNRGAVWAADCDQIAIEACIFENNIQGRPGGIYLAFCTDATIKECTFVGNVGEYAGGVATLGSTGITIQRCTFNANKGGVYIGYGDSVAIEKCIIANSTERSAVYGDPERISCCNLFNNFGGDWIDSIAGQIGINGNISADPLFCDAEAGDYRIDVASLCAPANNDCGTLIGALGVGCGCDCSNQGDCNNDGIISPTDVVYLINYALRGGSPPPTDPDCPVMNRGDFNCDNRINLVDVVATINYVFRQPAPGPCDPCEE